MHRPSRNHITQGSAVGDKPDFQLPHLHLTYPTCIWRFRWGSPRLSFAEILSVRKLETLGYCVALFARQTFNRFSRTPTCADRHTTTAYTALAWRPAVKTYSMLLNADYVSTQISVILGLNIHLKEGDKSGVIQNCDYSKRYQLCNNPGCSYHTHMKLSNKMLKI